MHRQVFATSNQSGKRKPASAGVVVVTAAALLWLALAPPASAVADDWRSMMDQGNSAELFNDYRTAEKAYADALQIAERSGDRGHQFDSLAHLTATKVILGQYDESELFYKKVFSIALELQRNRTLDPGAVETLDDLADVYETRKSRSGRTGHPLSPPAMQFVLEHSYQLRSQFFAYQNDDVAACAYYLIAHYIKTKNYVKAQALIHERINQLGKKDSINKAHLLLYDSYVCNLTDQKEKGASIDRAAEQMCRRIDSAPSYYGGLAQVHVAVGDYAAAIQYYQRALKDFRKMPSKKAAVVDCLLELGKFCNRQEDYVAAEKYFREGIKLTKQAQGEKPINGKIAGAYAGLGTSLRAQIKNDEAQKVLKVARTWAKTRREGEKEVYHILSGDRETIKQSPKPSSK